MPQLLDDARVLITGGTGSLGQALTRRILRGELGMPRTVIVFSRCEAKQYSMKAAWEQAHRATDDIYYDNFRQLLQFWIGDVRDRDTVERVVSRSDIVFHTAAMKQVPTCEYFPLEAAATNINGAENVVRAAQSREHVRLVIGVSTDKACKPINVMGMTKAVQERVLVEGNLGQEHCRMVAVRNGNVIGSRGSVIPLFRHQIASGGPLTITDSEMTRFLLTLDQAVDTIFATAQAARQGEIFVARTPSARITDVAAALIGERPIELVETGIRPGEKLHEELISDEEARRTVSRDGHFVLRPLLPELADTEEPVALTAAYSSAENLVHGAALRELLDGAVTPVDAAMAGI
jgi:FlaA1/EpsC-like NDP-sugar epimerase